MGSWPDWLVNTLLRTVHGVLAVVAPYSVLCPLRWRWSTESVHRGIPAFAFTFPPKRKKRKENAPRVWRFRLERQSDNEFHVPRPLRNRGPP